MYGIFPSTKPTVPYHEAPSRQEELKTFRNDIHNGMYSELSIKELMAVMDKINVADVILYRCQADGKAPLFFAGSNSVKISKIEDTSQSLAQVITEKFEYSSIKGCSEVRVIPYPS